MSLEDCIVIIGGGNMARAIASGVRNAERSGGAAPDARVCRLIVAEPDRAKHAALIALGCVVFDGGVDAIEAAPRESPIVLAVKPQMLAPVIDELSKSADGSARSPDSVLGDRLVISILAGMTTASLARSLGVSVRIVRVMPNLPASLGLGATAICRGPRSTEADLAWARGIFASVGPLVVEIDEPLMDAFTALAGSGPAYVFYLAEAMIRAGETAGFDHATAAAIVRATIVGSGELLARSQDPPEILRAAVTSKGGTTAAAIATLDHADAMRTIIHAILAARDRGRELGGGTGG